MDHGRNERCNVRFPDLDARCKDRVSKPQFNGRANSEDSVVVVGVCVCERWIEEEMRWQVVGVFSA